MKMWGIWVLAGVQLVATILLFTLFESATDAAATSVSVGFLLTTVVYVVESRRMASASEQMLRLERERDDRVRLDALLRSLEQAKRGMVRSWNYFRFNGAVGAYFEEDDEAPKHGTMEAFTWAIAGDGMVSLAREDLRRNAALLTRCNLRAEADAVIDALTVLQASTSMYGALWDRRDNPGDEDEEAYAAWVEATWRAQQEEKSLPPWEDVESGRPENDAREAVKALERAIGQYFAKQ